MVFALALLIAAPATFETYVLAVEYDGPVRLVVNGVRVEEPTAKRVPIEHYVVPGANHVFIEPLDAKKKAPKLMARVMLVVGRNDSRSWEKDDGQVIATLKRGGAVFTVPQSLREPLWRLGAALDYEAEITYRAKVRELHAMLVAKDVDGYVEQLAESYAETERLFPMVKADALRKRDAEALRAMLAKAAVSPLPDDKTFFVSLEAYQHLAVAMKKGTRETFKIGGSPVLISLIKINGALRPYAAIRP
ncbi:MAG: hypothetical protein ACAI38_02535 [Myxococcota bacterium]